MRRIVSFVDPGYDDMTMNNDIAVAQLDFPVTFSREGIKIFFVCSGFANYQDTVYTNFLHAKHVGSCREEQIFRKTSNSINMPTLLRHPPRSDVPQSLN